MSLFAKQIKSQISGIKPYVPGKAISELQRELNLTRVSKLASNENPLGCSPKVQQAIQNLLADVARYPDGSAFELKQALAKHLSLTEQQIAIGNGSNELLELVARIFAGIGDEIIYSEYAFAVYPISAQVVGAKGICVAAREWEHDLTAMLDAITAKTKVIYIANPNNPTGTLITRFEWDNFIQKVPEKVVIVLDEAYFEYVEDDKTINGLDYLASHPNLLVSRTFSKAYGLASLRIGYILGCEEIISYIEKVRTPFNVNQFAQTSAIIALNDQVFVKQSIELNNQGMKQLTDFFENKKLSYIPSSGNFICVNVGEQASNINQQLLKMGVIVRSVANYNMDNFLRISIGTTKENNHFIEALNKIICQ